MSRLKHLRNGKDWHRAEIVAALHMSGTSVERLSRQHGFNCRALALGLTRAWPKAEIIIANALGMKPEDIWPSRYDGTTRRRGLRPNSALAIKERVSNANVSTVRNARNVDVVDMREAA